MEADYSKLTDEMFDGLLEKILEHKSAAEILAIPGVAEAVREDLNDEVLEAFEEEHPNLAFPLLDNDDEGV